MSKEKKTAFTLPEINSKCIDFPYKEISGILNNPKTLKEKGGFSKDRELHKQETEVEKLISKMPSIAKSAGYSLLSKLFGLWLNPSTHNDETEIGWDMISDADDFGILERHIEVAKTALEFSLLPQSNLKNPNLSGIGKDFSVELNNALNGTSFSKNVNSVELRLPVYRIIMNSISLNINNAIMERFMATRSILRDDIEIREYNRVFNKNSMEPDIYSAPPIKKIRKDNLQIIVQVSQLLAALGQFELKVFAKIDVSKTEKGQLVWSANKVIYRIEDTFNFNANAYLGHWDVKGLSYGYPMGIKLNDKILRDYGMMNNLKDVKFFSEFTEDIDSPEYLYRKKVK